MGKFISDPKLRGQKYGFEASIKWIEFGKKKLHFEKIYAITSVENVINIKLNNKLGFRKIENHDHKGNKWVKMVYS